MKKVEEKMFMKVTSVYGLTEAAPGMTATRLDDPFDVRCNTVGRDFEFTEVRVIDPETGEECPIGVQGEMCNRGYNTMKGYYKNPEATAEVIDRTASCIREIWESKIKMEITESQGVSKI